MAATAAWTAQTHAMRRAAAAALPPRRDSIGWQKSNAILKYWNVWQDRGSIVHRLPIHYQNRFWSSILADPSPVHTETAPKNRFRFDPDRRVLFENEHYHVEPIYPPEFHEGLWGGEGIIKGYKVSKPYTRKKVLPRQWIPRLYFPALKQAIVYSEVLDKYMKLIVTERALRLIDKHFGLDLYLLETPDHDLKSRLALGLKREILMKIARDDFPTEDEDMLAELKEKYAKFKIPYSEAEWVGLELNEACKKQQILEEENAAENSVPHKFIIEQKLVEHLNKLTVDDKKEKGETTGLLDSLKFWE